MSAIIIAALGRIWARVSFWFALAGIGIAALWVVWRDGKAAGSAAYATRRADAKVRSLQASKETRHDVQNARDADLDRRLDRWMRDGPPPPSR